MGAREHWLEITPSGDVFLLGENDGWVFLRKGAERSRTPVIITEVKAPNPGSPWWFVWYARPNGVVTGGHSVTQEEAAVYRQWMQEHPQQRGSQK